MDCHEFTLGESTARLCTPHGGARCVQVLLHGGTYDRNYWSWPHHHSYVEDMVARGHATAVLDLPDDHPPRPPAEAVTLERYMHLVHKWIGALRKGTLGPRYERIVVVGHSVGSMIAMAEAAEHNDADAVVLSGFAHGGGNLDVMASFTSILEEEAFADETDGGYLTTRAGTRRELMHTDTDDAAVIADDEATKGVLPTPIVAALATALTQPTVGIRVPVLVVNGERDAIFSSPDVADAQALAAREREYLPGTTVDAAIIPAAGHSLTLSARAPEFASTVWQWLTPRGGSADA